jgi:hypothetical protein
MNVARTLGLVSMLAIASACLPGVASADPAVELHCVAPAMPEGFTGSVVTPDAIDAAADPAPGAGEVCFTDEDTAWTVAGTGSTRVAKYWTGTNYTGSSLTLSIDNDIDGGDGCADGDIYGFAALGEFKDDIASAKGFNGCTSLRFWNYKNFKNSNGGSSPDYTCTSPCSTLGTFNNKAASTKVRQ